MQNTSKRPRINDVPNPACIHANNNVWADEIYEVKGTRLKSYKRVELLKRVTELAVRAKKDFIITLNKIDFCVVYTTGKYKYIYDASKDYKISNHLKQLFKEKGFTIN